MDIQPIDEKAVLAYYEQELQGIEKIWEELEQKRANLTAIISGIKERVKKSELKSDESFIDSVGIPSRAFKGMTIGDAAEKYLEMVGKGQTARHIADALLLGGYETDSKNFYDTVRSRLKERKAPNGAFLLINGLWILAKWEQNPTDNAE